MSTDSSRHIDLSSDVAAIRAGLERQRKARVSGKILTPESVEKLEVDRMLANLKEIERTI